MFAEKLINWYLENGRQLPWRGIGNPYYIWLSEIILQQTRIEQGRSYYERFVTEYPTVRHLAEASEEQVLKSWQGLGYYSRARNLHEAARYIAFDLGGRFPNTYEGIQLRRLRRLRLGCPIRLLTGMYIALSRACIVYILLLELIRRIKSLNNGCSS